MRAAALSACLLLGTAPLHAAEPASAEGPEFFTTQVRPILSRHCFKCHGPDEKARKAKLRLDVPEGITRTAHSGQPIVAPGKPEESDLVQRILSKEKSDVMPPPQAKDTLADAEKKVLERWVAAGAGYTIHWAFRPPRQAPLPEVRQRDWPRNALDRFVLARLEAEGLAPSPEADRHTLVRRVYLDLIGLPPTAEEAEAFVRDPAPDAYERLVDHLLASPHYGERWARRWLDLARYADTNGYEKDRQRSIWPYRDWVIRALNADLPFDEFTIDQLAGDLLPNATLDQKVATGFHRNTMLNEEGGIDPLEFRYYAMTDRVATTSTVWLGLTLGCAQCHAHKFDPIPHREYYQFMAFLDNADEVQMDVPRPDLARQRREQEEKIVGLTMELPKRFPPAPKRAADDPRTEEVRRRDNLEQHFTAWLEQEAARTVRWTMLRPVAAKANVPLLTVLADNSVLASGDMTKRDVYDLKFSTRLRGITAIRLEVLPDDSLPRRGPGRVFYEGPFGDFFLSEFTVAADGKKVALKGASHSLAKDGSPASAAIDGDPQTGWMIDGGQGRPHAAVFTLATPLGDVGELDVQLLFERYFAAGLGRFRISATTDPRPAVAREMPAEMEDQLLVAAAERTDAQRQRLLEYYLGVAPELANERAAIAELRKQVPSYPTTLVFAERPAENPRPTFVHNRGEFLQPAERVEPAPLSVLPPLPKDVPRNRLGLARWLVSPDNPLVGRVTMNREWAAFFGRGIVRTTGDFGYQGEAPSNAELLDWLAVELVRQGWSTKKMHRLIVTSATYRQASRVTAELLALDPENRLLARGPRVRLEAELVRDTFLADAGLLSQKIGGPSVFPPQPPGVTTEGTYGQINWQVSPGDDRYRRGLYTFSKRTAPYAMFSTFDAPAGEVCLARREVSNSPLQALTLLNDPVFTEVTQALGRRSAAEAGTTEARATSLFRRCLIRQPAAEELAKLVRFQTAQKQRFERKELDAAAVAGPGEDDVNERAAWTALARVLLNLDEAITKE